MVKAANMNSLRDAELSLEKLDLAAWLWDAERCRIISANSYAVKFWNELSVLDLIDTMFGDNHPITRQFSDALKLVESTSQIIDSVINFESIDIEEHTNCQFSQLEIEDGRNIILVKVTAATVSAVKQEAPLTRWLQQDGMTAAMLDQAPVALALFDQQGSFVYANKSCQQIVTADGDKFNNPISLQDWFKQADEKTDAKSLIEKCLKYDIANMSAKLDTTYGERTHNIIAKSFSVDLAVENQAKDGNQYILIYLRDVADERNYEQILLERIKRLEGLTDLASDFYFILDDGLNFVKIGGDFERLTGYQTNEIFAKNWHDVARRFSLDNDNILGGYFSSQTAIDNFAINWPVKDTEDKLSLTLRSRSLFDTRNGKKIFIGNYIAAFETILSVSDSDLLGGLKLDGVSEHIEILSEDDESFEEIEPLTVQNDDPIIDSEIDNDVVMGVDIAIVPEETTNDRALECLETNLSDNEAVNFASLAETLAADNDVVAQEAEAPILADNIVPAFGASKEQISKFGRQNIDMFKLILDQTPVMIVVTSLPSENGVQTLFANKEILHNLGLISDKNEETPPNKYSDMVSVETMEAVFALKDEFGDASIDQEVSFLVAGRKYYFDAKINKIVWHENKALQYFLSPKIVASTVMIEPEVGAEVENEASTDGVGEVTNIEQPNNILHFVIDGQVFIDKEKNILSSNKHLNRMLKRDDDLVGVPFSSIVATEYVGAFEDYLGSVLQNDEKNLSVDGIEISLLDKAGTTQSVFLHIQKLNDEEAENFPSHILINLRDISRWKKKEQNLRDAKDRAEQENIQKSGFLARISHELRTPLNAIIGFSEVMSDEKFGPLENSRYKGYAHDINESGEHLLSLINDLLDLSKIEAGKVELDFKALDLEPLILQSVSLMQPMADKKRIIIRTSVSSTLPKIVADLRSIRQIILNLLSNSIKYSNPGSQVIISALLDDEGEVIIRVRDTGIGMAEEQLKTAMEPFKTLDISNLVNQQGTGLGLPLTKALAEANRADFSIESAVDAGTLVQITFPTTRVLNA